MMESFGHWLTASELGQYLFVREQAFYDRIVADAFGFRAVQVGLPQLDFLAANRIPWKCRAGQEPGADVRCLPEQLPFESRSLDLVVLPHILDFSIHPHQVLREAERVLMPEGRVVLTGFNPVSLWGVRRLIEGRQQVPWNAQFLSLVRIKDWLTLLDLEPEGGSFMGYCPPFARADWLERFRFMEKAGDRWWPLAAGVYGIQAIKRQRGMRLIMPQWKPAKAAKGLAVAGGNDHRHSAGHHTKESV